MGIKSSLQKQKHKETTANYLQEGGNKERSTKEGEGRRMGRKEERDKRPARADGGWSGLCLCLMVAFYYLKLTLLSPQA